MRCGFDDPAALVSKRGREEAGREMEREGKMPNIASFFLSHEKGFSAICRLVFCFIGVILFAYVSGRT